MNLVLGNIEIINNTTYVAILLWKQHSPTANNVREQSIHKKYIKIRSVSLQGKCEKQSPSDTSLKCNVTVTERVSFFVFMLPELKHNKAMEATIFLFF
jgi:hypothetical protein